MSTVTFALRKYLHTTPRPLQQILRSARDTIGFHVERGQIGGDVMCLCGSIRSARVVSKRGNHPPEKLSHTAMELSRLSRNCWV